MVTVLAIIAFLALLPAVAWRWGADSRDGYDWHQAPDVPARRGPVNLPDSWLADDLAHDLAHAAGR